MKYDDNKNDDGHRYKDVCIVTPIAYSLLHWFKCQPQTSVMTTRKMKYKLKNQSDINLV